LYLKWAGKRNEELSGLPRPFTYASWTTLLSYLRIATHPSIFASPLTPKQAMSNVSSLLSVPHLRVLSEEEGFWQVHESVAGGLPVRGNLVPDAHLAALLRQNGVRSSLRTILISANSGFCSCAARSISNIRRSNTSIPWVLQ